jgi:hypothetical protein
VCHIDRAVDVFISLAFFQRHRRQLTATGHDCFDSPGCAYRLRGVHSAPRFMPFGIPPKHLLKLPCPFIQTHVATGEKLNGYA